LKEFKLHPYCRYYRNKEKTIIFRIKKERERKKESMAICWRDRVRIYSSVNKRRRSCNSLATHVCIKDKVIAGASEREREREREREGEGGEREREKRREGERTASGKRGLARREGETERILDAPAS